MKKVRVDGVSPEDKRRAWRLVLFAVVSGMQRLIDILQLGRHELMSSSAESQDHVARVLKRKYRYVHVDGSMLLVRSDEGEGGGSPIDDLEEDEWRALKTLWKDPALSQHAMSDYQSHFCDPVAE